MPGSSAALGLPAVMGTGTASECVGTAEPRRSSGAPPLTERSFAFVDLCGFTGFMATNGEHAAIDALEMLHRVTGEVATRRGVRVAKWLGDGAMLVGVDVGPTIAAATELIARFDGESFALRGGVAHGEALLFGGDDYVGRPVNLAARLCAVARPGELLAMGYPRRALPNWIEVVGTRDVTLRGLGRFRRVQRLGLAPGLIWDRRAPAHEDDDGSSGAPIFTGDV